MTEVDRHSNEHRVVFNEMIVRLVQRGQRKELRQATGGVHICARPPKAVGRGIRLEGIDEIILRLALVEKRENHFVAEGKGKNGVVVAAHQDQKQRQMTPTSTGITRQIQAKTKFVSRGRCVEHRRVDRRLSIAFSIR